MSSPQTILITGASRGIGLETARQLAAMGHNLVLTARNKEKLAAALGKTVRHSLLLTLDTGNLSSIAQAAVEFSRSGLRLDVLINNAAILDPKDESLLQDPELLPQVLNVNSFGPLRVIKAFLPFMNRPGRIVNLSSGGGSMSDPVGGWAPAYCVSKSLLNAITRQLAAELESEDIAINAVCPGWVRTAMGGRAAPRSVEKGAETPVWLALEASAKLTGKFFRDKKEIPW